MKLTINLASRSYVNERALKWGYLLFAMLILLVLLFQVRNFLHSYQLKNSYQSNIAAIEQTLRGKTTVKLTRKQIAAQQQDLKQAKILLRKDAFRWTALFDRVENLLPRNVSVRSFSPNYGEGSLVLTGVAKKLPDLQMLLENLHAESFRQVYLKSQSNITVLDYLGEKRSAVAFSIELEGVF
jgi:type IV pilus assembly protein PilN